jgi:2-polyprenyl-6-methoxyphenol hydroxylase-like FAD-dependent oxidoreductase
MEVKKADRQGKRHEDLWRIAQRRHRCGGGRRPGWCDDCQPAASAWLNRARFRARQRHRFPPAGGGSLDLRAESGQRAIDAAGLSGVFAGLSRDDARAFRMIDSNGNDMPGAGEDTHEDAGPEIDWSDLRLMLVDALPEGMVAWGHRVTKIERLDDGRWQLQIADGVTVTADLVIGADGIGSRVRAALTDVQPIYTGITMVATYIRPELWRSSKLSEILGEGSVMFAGGNKTIFVQRCNHDVILLYYSMAVPQNWPEDAGFDTHDAKAMLAAVRDPYQDWSPELLDMLTQVQDDFHLWPTSVMPPDGSGGLSIRRASFSTCWCRAAEIPRPPNA